ncbi:MAG TPA: hypothetical protein VF173_19940 [Thermoanaerobaculia bacterium]|nr:hypothetical protein [Thermoanaerobaculia bacterium]
MTTADRESELRRKIQIIGRGLAGQKQQPYATLKAKRRAGTLTPQEQAELIALSDQVEEMNVQRMGFVVQLASLRQIPVDALMDELGIKSPLYE